MGHEIRKYMTDVDGDNGLSGHVEIDETYIGGVHKREKNPKGNRYRKKTIVLGMVERDGKVISKVIPDNKTKSI